MLKYLRKVPFTNVENIELSQSSLVSRSFGNGYYYLSTRPSELSWLDLLICYPPREWYLPGYSKMSICDSSCVALVRNTKLSHFSPSSQQVEIHLLSLASLLVLCGLHSFLLLFQISDQPLSRPVLSLVLKLLAKVTFSRQR